MLHCGCSYPAFFSSYDTIEHRRKAKVVKVIYHIDTMEAWPMTLGNVRHMLDWLHQNQEAYEIEVLANGSAVKAYLSEGLEDSLRVILAQENAEGVIFAACNNALKEHHIALETLIEKTVIVPAGVIELAQKQQEGFAYIKP